MNIYRTFSIVAVVSTIAIAVFFVASVVKTDHPELKPVANAATETAAPLPEASQRISSSVSRNNLLSTFDVDSAQEEILPWDGSPIYDTTERISYADTQSGWEGSDDSSQTQTFDSFDFGQSAASSFYSSSDSSGGDSAGRSSTDFSSTGSSGSSSGGASGDSSGGSAADPASDSSGSEGTGTDTDGTANPDPVDSGNSGAGAIDVFRDISVTVISSMERLLRDDISAPGTSSAQIFCAKNETEAFQVIVTNKSYNNLPDLEFTISNWEGPSTNKKPKMTLFREHYVRIDKPSYGLPADTPTGWYPDALIPFVDPYTDQPITSGIYQANHASVAGRENQGYWADVRVDSEVPAGTYTCSMLVTSSDRPVAEIPVTLTVWDFALPTQRQYTTWWYGFYNVHQWYGLQSTSGQQYVTFLERYQDMAYAHGIYPANQSPVVFGGTRNSDGTMTFTNEYHNKISAFVKKYGKGVIRISDSYLFSDSENWVLYSDAQITNTLAGYNTMSKAHPEYGQYVIYLDEPWVNNQSGGWGTKRQDAVKKLKDLMNTIPDLHIKMVLTGSKYAYDILDSQGNRCADTWICYGKSTIEDGLKAKPPYTIEDLAGNFLSTEGKTIWATGAESTSDGPLTPFRDLAWYNYTFGAAGSFGWLLALPHNWSRLPVGLDPWTSAASYVNVEGKIVNGYCSLIFPGSSDRMGISGIGGPIATMRLKTWRKGCEDFEYFKILEGLTDKSTVDAIVSGVVTGYSTNANLSQYEAARKNIAQLILQHRGNN